MRPPLALLALTAMALAMDRDDDLTPEQRKVREERLKAEEAQRAKERAERSAAYKAEQDAIAAPYREARRLRNLRKMQQEHRKP